MKIRHALAFGVALSAISVPASAQDAAPEDRAEGDALGFDQIVVTAAARPTNRLDSSVSVSALDAGAIAEAAPRTTAEIFRQIAQALTGRGEVKKPRRGLLPPLLSKFVKRKG